MVFYLPLFYVTVVVVLLLPFRAARAHWHPVWFVLCCAAILLGLLRESTLIPTLRDPELDLLAAFGPFVVGSVCLLLTVRSLTTEAATAGGTVQDEREQAGSASSPVARS